MLGLAMRAGKLASGEFAVEKAVRDGKAYVVIVAEDASEGTGKKFRDMCSYYETEFLVYGKKEELGRVLGKSDRSSAAVTDEQMAAAVMKLAAGPKEDR